MRFSGAVIKYHLNVFTLGVYKMKRLQANTSYSLIHATMWGMYAIIFAFATNFLSGQGLENYQISIVLGATAAVSCILQVVIGELVSRFARLKVYTVMLILGALMLLGLGGMLLSAPVPVIGGICTVLTLLQLVPGLCNSIGMDAIAKGAPATYAIARGMGSLFYALSATFIGVLVDRSGEKMIPLTSMVLGIGLIAGVVWFHFGVEKDLREDAPTAVREKKGNRFLSKNPKFSVFLIGATFLCVSHFLVCTFMKDIIEAKQGASTEQGIATGISAFVELPIMFGFALIVKRVRCDVLLRLSAFMFLAKTVGLYLADVPTGVYAAQATQALGYGLYAIASVTYAGKLFGKEEAVRAQSYLAATISAGSVVAMSTGGVLIQLLGVQVMILAATGCALAGALIIAFSTQKTE